MTPARSPRHEPRRVGGRRESGAVAPVVPRAAPAALAGDRRAVTRWDRRGHPYSRQRPGRQAGASGDNEGDLRMFDHSTFGPDDVNPEKIEPGSGWLAWIQLSRKLLAEELSLDPEKMSRLRRLFREDL